ncbi:MAG: hypothetical protein WCT41_00395 [Candidatus Paceibacterota bacterium]
MRIFIELYNITSRKRTFYATTLRSMTEGRGSMTMEFNHYDVVPTNVAADIIASRK